MLFVIPSLGLSVVMTSDESLPSAANGYLSHLNDLLTEIVIALRDEPDTSVQPAGLAIPATPSNPQL